MDIFREKEVKVAGFKLNSNPGDTLLSDIFAKRARGDIFLYGGCPRTVVEERFSAFTFLFGVLEAHHASELMLEPRDLIMEQLQGGAIKSDFIG